jgi:hypothetical protein
MENCKQRIRAINLSLIEKEIDNLTRFQSKFSILSQEFGNRAILMSQIIIQSSIEQKIRKKIFFSFFFR